MDTKLSSATQDYLKAIYDLACQSGTVSTTDLARRLGFAPASVTGMLQRLAASDPALVIYHKHQGARLTPAGERLALEVIRHHRLIETYLVVELGYTWDTVHEEACRLEHVISEEFEQRIAELLGDPQRDPHGEPIPSRALELPQDDSLPLAGLRSAQRAIIRRVRSDDLDLLRYLKELGLTPGAKLEVRGYTPFDQNLALSVEDGAEIVVGLPVSSRIFVEVL